MPASLTAAPASADVGDTWRAWLVVVDLDAFAAAADTVTVAVTLPAGTAGTGTATAQTAIGLYLLEYDVVTAGSHTFVVTVTSAEFGDDVFTVTVLARATSGTLPDLAAVLAYLGEDDSHTPQEVQDALDAETAAQARHCTIPADYPEDLAQALKRRVARNLAARAVPVATFTSFEGGGTSARVPKLDAEITRFEAPFPRLAVG
jgi:hypothetical protein